MKNFIKKAFSERPGYEEVLATKVHGVAIAAWRHAKDPESLDVFAGPDERPLGTVIHRHVPNEESLAAWAASRIATGWETPKKFMLWATQTQSPSESAV